MLRKLYITLLTVLAGVLLATTAVYGAAGPFGDHPPEARVIYHGKYIQLTRGYSKDWYYMNDAGWQHIGPKTYRYSWPQQDHVKPGSRVNFVILSDGAKPDVLHIRRFGDVGDRPDREPLGRGVRVPYHFYPIRDAQGKIENWALRFTLPKGDHRIKLHMEWYRDKGTDHSYGKEVRLAHLRAF